MSEVAERLASVHARIEAASRACGRDPASVRLVAVSKFHPVAAIRAAYAAGQRDFGENYAQELVDKARDLADLPDLRFRFIGGLQRNKAKLLVDAGCAVETLASESAARALHERALSRGVAVEVMIQVNVAGEAQKRGVSVPELPALVQVARGCSALRLTGLMAIPPADDHAVAEHCYRTLARLAESHGLDQLSMGMSDDLELAIRTGSTSVRVGTAVFGPRP